MNNFYFEPYHVWHPDFRQALNNAILKKMGVVVTTHMPIDNCNNADLELHGRFVGFSGSFLQFVVEKFIPDIANNYPETPECEYSFKIEAALPENLNALFEYGGRAYIQDQELLDNNIPESLLLRLSPPSRIRRLRMHDRINSPGGLFLMPGLVLMDQEPINRRRLLALLGHYYKQKNRPKPELVDISAGGACLKTTDPHCQRFLGTEESYLFFFFSEHNGVLEPPNVFLAKKVGILRDDNAIHAGLRIKFLRELVWSGPNEDLQWKNIEFSGSEKIKAMFDKWNKTNSEIAKQDRGFNE